MNIWCSLGWLELLTRSYYWPPPIWHSHMAMPSVLQMLLSCSRFCRHLWMDLYETLTHYVYRSAVEHHRDFLIHLVVRIPAARSGLRVGLLPPQKWFCRFYCIVLCAIHSLERIVALLPWRSPVRLSVRLSVWDGRAYCDHTVHFSADLSLWLDSPMFWAVGTLTPNRVHLTPIVFSSSTWKGGGVWNDVQTRPRRKH